MNTSLYFHIPFCRRRCGYCDFVTFAGFEHLLPLYMEALNKQVKLIGNKEPVHTIYFGGGTPSLVPVPDYQRLFYTIHDNFNVNPETEITLEANPGTIDRESLDGYRKVGFNRISFGMQSAVEKELLLLERLHSPGEVSKAVENARTAGFKNINLDLIFGLPGQTTRDWMVSLEAALELAPEHLSLYSLIIEEGTPLEEKIQSGILPEPDEDTVAEQYERSCIFLERAGYEHYEISNWAKSSDTQDFRCQHNLQYWRLHPYMGFGCGAVGFLPDSWKNVEHPSMIMKNESYIGKYIKQTNLAYEKKDRNVFIKPVSTAYEMETRLFVGFRLLEEGINPSEFQERYKINIYTVFGARIDTLLAKNLIEIASNGNLRLKRSSWLVANRVFREFINEDE